MNEERREENPDVEIEEISFEAVIKERQDTAEDETYKPHEEPPPKVV